MQILGSRLRSLRRKKGLTQEQLGFELGCDKDSINRYENNRGQISTAILIRAAGFFEVTTDYLLGLSENMRNDEEVEHRNSILSDLGKCKNCAVFHDERYYWITLKDGNIGGQTQWVGLTDEGKEIKEFRPVIPDRVIAFCKELNEETPLIVNTEKECAAFLIFGGEAIIREAILKEHCPEWLEPFVV